MHIVRLHRGAWQELEYSDTRPQHGVDRETILSVFWRASVAVDQLKSVIASHTLNRNDALSYALSSTTIEQVNIGVASTLRARFCGRP